MAWEQVWDEASRQFYFYDNITGQTQWEVPNDYMGEVQPDEIAVSGDIAQSLISTVTHDQNVAASEWIKCYDEASGMWFFFNQKTSETQWDEPVGFQSKRQQRERLDDEHDDDDDDYEYVAVITEYRPLCSRCFGKKKPLYRSKSFYLVLLFALMGLIGGSILALGDCKSKTVKSTFLDISSYNTTSSYNFTSSKNVTNFTETSFNITSDVDLVFIYDKSNSMQRPEVLSEQANIETMILQFNQTLGEKYKLKVGVLSFGCGVQAEVNLTFDLYDAIDRVTSSGVKRTGCTRTDLALEAYQNMMNCDGTASSYSNGYNEIGARNNSAKVAVLMSDGAVCCPGSSFLEGALTKAQEIKDANQTILSVYVNNNPSASTANEMWKFSSCAPNSTGNVEANSTCDYYFDGTFDELTEASSSIAENIAFSIASDQVMETSSVSVLKQSTQRGTSTETTKVSQPYSVEDEHCVFDPRWYFAFGLVLPLLIYFLLRYCVVPVANKAEEAIESLRESTMVLHMPHTTTVQQQPITSGAVVASSTPSPNSSETLSVESSFVNPMMQEMEMSVDPVLQAAEEGESSMMETCEAPPPAYSQEQTTSPVKSADLPPKKKWETVKTNHYLWAMQGGTTKLDINFGKNFDANSLPSAPSAVDKSGKVMIKLVKDVKKDYKLSKTSARSSIVTRSSILAKRKASVDASGMSSSGIAGAGEAGKGIDSENILPSPPISTQPTTEEGSYLPDEVNGGALRQKRRSVAVLSKRGLKLDKQNQKKPKAKVGFFSSMWLFMKRLFGCTRHTSASSSKRKERRERPRSARVDLGGLGGSSGAMFSGSNPFSNFHGEDQSDFNTDL